MVDVVALGELLIDFTPAGKSEAGNVLFERNPGGAPANVLTALTKLGGKGAFIGKVGNDQFGHYLKSVLDENRIESNGLSFSNEVNTTLAFVHLKDDGDRSFSFYRKPGADIMLEEKDLDFSIIDGAKVFHFGSLSLTNEPSKSATLKAVKYAKEKGLIISYDPNYRAPLWENDIVAKQGMELGLEYADILKVSESELEFLTGEKDLEQGSIKLYNMGIKLIIVTLGPEGCYYRYKKGTGKLSAYEINAIDTTGSGDAFLGSFLYQITRLNCPIDMIEKDKLEEMLEFANAVGGLCATKMGAIPAMPDIIEVQEFLKTGKSELVQQAEHRGIRWRLNST